MTMKLDLIRNTVKYMVKVLPFYLLVFLPITLSAQTFTQRLQKSAQGESTVTIHHNKAIDDLVNGAHIGTQIPATKTASTAEKVAAKPVAAKKQTETAAPEKKEVRTQSQQRNNTSKQQTTDTTTVQKSGRTYKVMGYRVQVFAGGNSRMDRQKANQIGNQLRELFPHEPVYVHFYSPRWVCRMGNYRTYEEAFHVLQEVKKLDYSAATIIKGKITVQY
jgi:hypothetical protein